MISMNSIVNYDWLVKNFAKEQISLIIVFPMSFSMTNYSVTRKKWPKGGKGAEYGVLIKGGEPLEMAEKIKAIVFDKTGTLTKGKPEVTDFINYLPGDQSVLSILCSIEAKSEHPLAEAIVRYGQNTGTTNYQIDSFQAIPGFGVKATVNGQLYFVGNQKLLTDNKINIDSSHLNNLDTLQNTGKTAMFISNQKKFLV